MAHKTNTVYFLLHDFIYGWDVSHFEETDGKRHICLMDTVDEANLEMKDVEHEADLWKVERGVLDFANGKVISESGLVYDYYQD